MLIIGLGELSTAIPTLDYKRYKEPRRNRVIRNSITLKPIFSEEHKKKLSKAHIGNTSALGHSVSEEARKIMSIRHIGKKASDKYR